MLFRSGRIAWLPISINGIAWITDSEKPAAIHFYNFTLTPAVVAYSDSSVRNESYNRFVGSHRAMSTRKTLPYLFIRFTDSISIRIPLNLDRENARHPLQTQTGKLLYAAPRL